MGGSKRCAGALRHRSSPRTHLQQTKPAQKPCRPPPSRTQPKTCSGPTSGASQTPSPAALWPTLRRPRSAARLRVDPKAVAVDAWLAALRLPDPRVQAPESDLVALAETLNAWHRTESADSDPVRTCFRIVPPPDEEDEQATPPDEKARQATSGETDWRIEFALQAVDDPSLLVSAYSVWADGAELTALERHVTHPDEHLLKGLGHAARLVPSLGPALTAAEPSEQVTDAAGALGFLRDGAPLLEQAGFGILAPPWWRSSRARLGLKMKAKSTPQAPGAVPNHAIGLEGLCAIEWEAVLGEDPISLTELRQLARLKQPLVRIRGQWVEMRAGDIEAAIAAVTSKGAGNRIPAGEVVRTALGIEMPAGDLPVTAVEADGWLGDLLAGADDHRLKARGTPETFDGQLRPYQERGLGWLAFPRADSASAHVSPTTWASERPHSSSHCCWTSRPEPMQRRPRSSSARCRSSATGSERRRASHRVSRLHAPRSRPVEPARAFTATAKRSDLVLSTYGLAARDSEFLPTVTWGRLVLDEAQQIKNSAARTTQKRPARSPHSHRIAMTGTPVENRLSELWSIMQFLNPGLLGSEKGFRERFAIPIERDGDDEAAERLRRITGPFVLRRLKTDRSIIRDLPDKLEMKEFCTPDTRAGEPLPGGRGRHARQDRGGGRHRAPRARARHHVEAQAGLQPPCPLPG